MISNETANAARLYMAMLEEQKTTSYDDTYMDILLLEIHEDLLTDEDLELLCKHFEL